MAARLLLRPTRCEGPVETWTGSHRTQRGDRGGARSPILFTFKQRAERDHGRETDVAAALSQGLLRHHAVRSSIPAHHPPASYILAEMTRGGVPVVAAVLSPQRSPATRWSRRRPCDGTAPPPTRQTADGAGPERNMRGCHIPQTSEVRSTSARPRHPTRSSVPCFYLTMHG